MDRHSFWQELACILNSSFNQRLEAEPKKHIKPSHSDFSPVLFAVSSFLCLCQAPNYRGERRTNATPTKLFIRSEPPKNSREEKKVGEDNNIAVTLKTVFYSVAEELTPISNYPLFLLPAMWLVLSFNIQMHLLPEKINCQL